MNKRAAFAVPGAFDALSALLVERAGFKAVYISGAGLSNSCGLPDTGLLSRAEVKAFSGRIASAVNIPAIVDADTGFGGVAGVGDTVRALESVGVAAIQLEDQEFPKRCGHLPGKRLVPPEEFADKIRAAVATRRNRDLVIIARTDARAVEGMDGAVKRARLYIKAGADVIFPEALESRGEFLHFSGSVKGVPLMANMTEFGMTPYLTVDEFGRLGYKVVIFPMTALRSAMKAIEKALHEIKAKGSQKGFLKRLQTRKELYELLKYEH